MKIALFRCCNTHIFLKHNEAVMDSVLRKLDVEAVEVKEFGCCGYPIKNINFKAYILCSARNLSLAEKKGLNIITFCSCCYSSLKRVNHLMKEDVSMQKEINTTLEKEGLRYDGGVEVKHFLDIVYKDIGIKNMREKIAKTFKGLNIATHYGCQLLKPRQIIKFDNPAAPSIFDELVEITGAKSISWPTKLQCCGAPTWGINDDLSMDLMEGKIRVRKYYTTDRFTSVAATINNVVIGRDNMTKVRLDNKQVKQQAQNISLRKQSFHIITGSFRKYTNAVTKVNQLKALGYKAKILEINQKGLRQVSYDSYNNKEDALYNLSIIRKTHDKEAWILIKELDEPVNDIKTQEKIVKKIEQTVSSNRSYIKIEPIYFGFDRWSLSNTELYELDKVVQIMKDNPTIIVEAGAHTDSKNLETYNQLLSEKRAKNVVKYIISKGINSNRITGKGYGEKQYVNRCRSFVKCTAAEQQANRRIEFVIVDGNVYPETETIQKSNGEKYLNHNPIYFNFDKYDIRKDALYELKRIVRIMKENPDMKIIAESHTDSQNRESYNQILSEKRAETIKNYIISQGINVNRIISRGFGETQLINHCKSFVKCTSKEHQENRRTEFKIVKM